MIRTKAQTFNDGVVRIYSVGDIAAPGDMPKQGLTLKDKLRFKRRTVGIKRYYTAMQASQQVDAVIRCPFKGTVSAQDVAVLDGKQYRVDLVQRPDDISPPIMDLTLSRLEQDYEFEEGS